VIRTHDIIQAASSRNDESRSSTFLGRFFPCLLQIWHELGAFLKVLVRNSSPEGGSRRVNQYRIGKCSRRGRFDDSLNSTVAVQQHTSSSEARFLKFKALRGSSQAPGKKTEGGDEMVHDPTPFQRNRFLCPTPPTADATRFAWNRAREIELDRTASDRLCPQVERWPSGRRRPPAKRVYGQKPYRGFESHPLRQFGRRARCAQ
jgi:hypothetical protein